MDAFMHEEQICVIEEYVNFEHMKVVLDVLQKGLAYTEKYMIRQGEGSQSDTNDNDLESSRRSSSIAMYHTQQESSVDRKAM